MRPHFVKLRSNLVLACLLLAACAQAPVRNPLATWVPSSNYDTRRPVIIVLHATEQGSAQESLDTLRSRNSGGKVSAHYLIGEDGRLYQLVADAERAWHAGGGRWGTITDLNSASIGIELDNDGIEPDVIARRIPVADIRNDARIGLGYAGDRSGRFQHVAAVLDDPHLLVGELERIGLRR